MKKLTAALLLTVIILSFTACAQKNEPPVQTVMPESAPEENTDIVAIVGDEIILLEEVEALLENTLGSFEGMELDFSDEELFDLYDGLLDTLIDDQVTKQKAKELGYTNLSDADLMLAYEYVEYEKQQRFDYFCELAAMEGGEGLSEEDIEFAAAQMVAEYVADTKETDEYLLELYTYDIAVENMFAELLKDVSVSDEEMNEMYLERVEADKQYYAEHPDYFASDRITSMLYYNIPGYRYVKNVVTYDETKAQELMGLVNTVNFDTLIVEYGEDDGAENFENGYAVCEGCEDFDPAFVSSAMALKNPGDVSDIVTTDDGAYHIIMYVADIPEGQVPFEEVEQSLFEELVYNRCEEIKAELIEEWKNGVEIIKFPEIFGL